MYVCVPSGPFSPLAGSSLNNDMSSGAPKKSLVARLGMPFLRLLGGACGCTVIALGAYDISKDDHDLRVIVNNIYRIVFGLLIIASEFRARKLLTWFSFFTYFVGMGAFYIFVGGLAMGTAWYEVTIAVVLCFVGVMYLGSACACAEYAPENDKSEDLVAAKSSDSNPSNPPPSGRYGEMEDGNARRQNQNASSPFAKLDDEHTGNNHQHARSSYGNNSGPGDIDPFAGHNPRSSAYD